MINAVPKSERILTSFKELDIKYLNKWILFTTDKNFLGGVPVLLGETTIDAYELLDFAKTKWKGKAHVRRGVRGRELMVKQVSYI